MIQKHFCAELQFPEAEVTTVYVLGMRKSHLHSLEINQASGAKKLAKSIALDCQLTLSF